MFHKLKLHYLQVNVPEVIVMQPWALSETMAEGNKVGGPKMHMIASNNVPNYCMPEKEKIWPLFF